MALSQSALQRKKQKKQSKRTQVIKNKMQSILKMQQIPLPERGTIYDAWMSEHLQDTGIGHIIISRIQPNDTIIMVDFLVDTYCLGVKNVLIRKETQTDYGNLLDIINVSSELIEIEPEFAKKLILETVQYANSIGIKPHNNYAKYKTVFADIEVTDTPTKFSFGKDGKPFIVQGPNDSPSQIQSWMKALRINCGENSFNYLLETSNILE